MCLLQVTTDTTEDGLSTSTIAVVDTKNKIIAGSTTLHNVQHVICAFGVVAAFLGAQCGNICKSVEHSSAEYNDDEFLAIKECFELIAVNYALCWSSACISSKGKAEHQGQLTLI